MKAGKKSSALPQAGFTEMFSSSKCVAPPYKSTMAHHVKSAVWQLFADAEFRKSKKKSCTSSTLLR